MKKANNATRFEEPLLSYPKRHTIHILLSDPTKYMLTSRLSGRPTRSKLRAAGGLGGAVRKGLTSAFVCLRDDGGREGAIEDPHTQGALVIVFFT